MTTRATHLIIVIVLTLYNAVGQELPAGVPRTIGPDGSVYVDGTFTTRAYREEALKQLVSEANRVADELMLPEKLPVTETNITKAFISPFGFAYTFKAIGNITTSSYTYGVERGDKFSDLGVADYDRTCVSYRNGGVISAKLINTNEAFQLASHWLSAVSMDVVGLNRDCRVRVEINRFWNGLNRNEELKKPKIVPIYDVWWFSAKDLSEGGDTAYVQLFSPTKTLLQLRVRDPKYILRKPIVFTNLDVLFPGVAPIVTNRPSAPIVIPRAPGPA